MAYCSQRLEENQRETSILNKISIVPLAAESLGVRSMCTLVETPDVTVLLDAGVSLSPSRFGLPPHPVEFQTIALLRKRIAEAADKAEVVTISHYHFDHHTPSFEDWLVNWTEAVETARQIYKEKRVLIKNPRENINPSQRYRAWLFQKTGGKHAKSLEIADGKIFKFGKQTTIRFSEAVTHGPENRALGWITMAHFEYGDESFVFAPDVQGPISKSALDWIISSKPDTAIIGGPPFYLGGFKVDEVDIQTGLRNLERLAEVIPLMILEHHALRDEAGIQMIRKAHEVANKAGNKVQTAAEFSGFENSFLESRRKRLFDEMPPSSEFVKWMNESFERKSVDKPPL